MKKRINKIKTAAAVTKTNNQTTHHPPALPFPTRRRSIRPTALLAVIFAAILLGGVAPARATSTCPVTVNIDCQLGGSYPVSGVMNGISEETGSVMPDDPNYNPTGYFWAATNTQIVQLFKNVGYTTIRIGGSSADGTNSLVETNGLDWTNAVDNFYAFAQACNLQTIWTLNLKSIPNGNTAVDAAMANYIFNHYGNNLEWIDIGNEPNEYAGFSFSPWLTKWQGIDTAVVDSVPDAIIGGPDMANGGTGDTTTFLNDKWGTDNLGHVTYHYEPCGAVNGQDEFELCEDMLSQKLDNNDYPLLASTIAYDSLGLTEFNPNYEGAGGAGGDTENTYAMALFQLDALHWWADNGGRDGNGIQGIYNHSGILKANTLHCAFYYDSSGTLQAYPLLYGAAAYQVGTPPGANPLAATVTSITGTNHVNLTVYATEQLNAGSVCTNLYVTIINKSFGGAGNPNGPSTNAVVRIIPLGIAKANPSVHAMWLIQSGDAVTATNGVTLGGDTIDGAHQWQGQWKDLGIMQSQYGYWNETVTDLTAVILEFSAPGN